MVASPADGSYEKIPEMSVAEVTKQAIARLKNYDFIGLNFSIPDMIAHTGNIKACIQSVQAVDKNIAKLQAALAALKGTLIITADHGNADKMLDLKTGEMYTEHTTAPVPFILVLPTKVKRQLHSGRLADVAPTILKLMNVKKPAQMTGKSLF